MIVGIACDTYKKDKFRKAFIKANIKIVSEGDFSPSVYYFKLDSEQHIVKPIVDKLQKYYHDTYKRGN